MANLKLVADAMFYNKNDWVKIPDEEKESCFFIFNRYFSKVYVEYSHFLNDKNIDKVMAMDLWYAFMKNKAYPRWFWSKSPAKEKSLVSPKDLRLLTEKLRIKEIDVEYLIEKHYNFIKEELKYWTKLEKQ